MKKLLRWVMGLLLVLIALGVIAFLSLDTVVKFIAEKRLSAETGMEAQIERLNISFRQQRVHLHNLTLINPPEFGGTTFVHLPELEVQYDLEALQSNRLHLKLVRLQLAEIHVVQSKAGKLNTALFTKLEPAAAATSSTNRTSPPRPARSQLKFAGLDTLEISLGRAKFTSELHPNQNFDKDLGIRNKVYRDIQTEKDLQNVGGVLVLQAGFNILMEKMLSRPE